MLSALEDINEQLFLTKAKTLGRKLEWNEIGGLVGAPEPGAKFIIGEYTFLLEDDNPNSDASDTLSDIYRQEANFQACIMRLNQRTALWQEYMAHRAYSSFGVGEAALPDMAKKSVLESQIRELTQWLEEDLPEGIANLSKLIPKLRETLTIRYPKREFIRFWPLTDSTAPPL